ncbi:MAG TPA: Shedu anti-phage system protein SduA domain-containing protein [Thermomicrobiales bacterium]|nr:Shedu anti-phage system protein SduA domain-containing protein [Thermomicrobiales bacterium]
MASSRPWPANRLVPFTYDPQLGRQSLAQFAALLQQPELRERADVLPFFRGHPHLAAPLGKFNPNLIAPDLLAYELSLLGRYTVDLVIGHRATGNFVLVEFEDGAADSIFHQSAGRTTPYWATRFERGYSQIIDWLNLVDNQQTTPEFLAIFDAASISVTTLLVIGRDHALTSYDRQRLEWRRNRVVVNGTRVLCLTYDELLRNLSGSALGS